MIQQQNRRLDAMAHQFNAATRITASRDVSARLAEMADFCRIVRGAMDDGISRWKRNRS
ncbi:hypothetical protein J6500_17455 [Bradyrhizobium sp. WSM 1704]|uniref:hypothetical protein n=1 Tax=Bradyrhizobium semiaridum TaxID=2821404 RepID=UPI001CE31B04|nr:hypothetical protein [Bradyrhizobium semiaridum]MCA6123670.1 hypothetical protein [Bradyrhizobium semiaridum]